MQQATIKSHQIKAEATQIESSERGYPQLDYKQHIVKPAAFGDLTSQVDHLIDKLLKVTGKVLIQECIEQSCYFDFTYQPVNFTGK